MLLRDGRAEVALGAMGGDGQPQTMVQLVTGLVDDLLDPQALVDRPRWVVATEGPGLPLGPGQPGVGRVGCDDRRGAGGTRSSGRAHRATDAGDRLGAGDPSPAGRLLPRWCRPARRLPGGRSPFLSETGSSARVRSGPPRYALVARPTNPLRGLLPSPKALGRLRGPAPHSEETQRDLVGVGSAALLVCVLTHLKVGPLRPVFPRSFC